MDVYDENSLPPLERCPSRRASQPENGNQTTSSQPPQCERMPSRDSSSSSSRGRAGAGIILSGSSSNSSANYLQQFLVQNQLPPSSQMPFTLPIAHGNNNQNPVLGLAASQVPLPTTNLLSQQINPNLHMLDSNNIPAAPLLPSWVDAPRPTQVPLPNFDMNDDCEDGVPKLLRDMWRKCNASTLCICLNFKLNKEPTIYSNPDDPLCICSHPCSTHEMYRKPKGTKVSPLSCNSGPKAVISRKRSRYPGQPNTVFDYRGYLTSSVMSIVPR